MVIPAAATRSSGGPVVVITGASSGIGRATAVAFARQRCRLVLAARREAALQETARLVERLGSETHVVVADVSRPEDIERLVSETRNRWHRIDVWINNAGTTLFGRLEDGDFAAHRQVLDTNLLGPMYAARLVMPVLKRQGRGIVINVGSVLSQVGQAFVPAYAISKFGLRGLSEALRSDVADYPDIHICTVLAYAVSTPHFEEGANAMGRRPYAMPPVQTPEKVAAAIVDLVRRPRRQRYVPRYIPGGLAAHWLLPRSMERLLLHALERFHMVGTQAPTDGGLFAPLPGTGATHGTRTPRVGRLAFAAWAVADLMAIALGAAWQGRNAPHHVQHAEGR
ncbi:MAG TPA: SDR family NAD(P)-dependent oxidoreductase [Luteitalea sp.]|nr:SDR family NAD(P)-dependent oxidoreductase [Luteitalea sp.]